MKLTEMFLEQLESEAKGTQRALENVPEGKNDWKPHEKSMPMGYLAALVATLPGWIEFMVNLEGVDVAAPEMARFRAQAADRTVELVEMFNQSVAKARSVLGSTSDEHLKMPWKFVMSGRVVSERPRYAMIRDSVFSHWAHHRGQLTVYLRLNGAIVPAVYGPSADERV